MRHRAGGGDDGSRGRSWEEEWMQSCHGNNTAGQGGGGGRRERRWFHNSRHTRLLCSSSIRLLTHGHVFPTETLWATVTSVWSSGSEDTSCPRHITFMCHEHTRALLAGLLVIGRVKLNCNFCCFAQISKPKRWHFLFTCLTSVSSAAGGARNG